MTVGFVLVLTSSEGAVQEHSHIIASRTGALMMGTTWAGGGIQVSYPPRCAVVTSFLKLLLTFKNLHALGGREKEVMEGRPGRQGKIPERKSLHQLLPFNFFKGSF